MDYSWEYVVAFCPAMTQLTRLRTSLSYAARAISRNDFATNVIAKVHAHHHAFTYSCAIRRLCSVGYKYYCKRIVCIHSTFGAQHTLHILIVYYFKLRRAATSILSSTIRY